MQLTFENVQQISTGKSPNIIQLPDTSVHVFKLSNNKFTVDQTLPLNGEYSNPSIDLTKQMLTDKSMSNLVIKSLDGFGLIGLYQSGDKQSMMVMEYMDFIDLIPEIQQTGWLPFTAISDYMGPETGSYDSIKAGGDVSFFSKYVTTTAFNNQEESISASGDVSQIKLSGQYYTITIIEPMGISATTVTFRVQEELGMSNLVASDFELKGNKTSVIATNITESNGLYTLTFPDFSKINYDDIVDSTLLISLGNLENYFGDSISNINSPVFHTLHDSSGLVDFNAPDESISALGDVLINAFKLVHTSEGYLDESITASGDIVILEFKNISVIEV